MKFSPTSRAHETKPFQAFRKVFHVLSSSTLPLYYWYHPFVLTDSRARVHVLIVSGLMFFAFFGLDFFRLRNKRLNTKIMARFSFLIRHTEERRYTGATHLSFAFFIVTLIFPREVAVTAMLFLSLGDTAAELGGKYFGKNKVFRRSIEGSIAFFLVAMPLAWAILEDWRVAFLSALFGTLVELFSFEVDDNLTVPIGSALAMPLAFVFVQTFFH
jgi:glycerol-3-phosphate acyltransferase PlsY